MSYWDSTKQEALNNLVGAEVIDSEWHETEVILALSNGKKLSIERNNDSCCSYIELKNVNVRPGIITAATFENTPDAEGTYRAWIHVIMEDASCYNLAEADADASNGYYLHGFALDVKILDE